jgi:integrase
MADLKPLTDRQLKATLAGEKALTDPTRPGLIYVPDAKRTGRGKWLFRYSSPETKKRREMGLGAFPETPAARARDLAEEHRRTVKGRTDPLEAAKREAAAKVAATNVLTFERAAREVWADLRAGWEDKTAQDWISTLSDYVFPVIGARPVADLTPKDIADALRPIWLAKANTAAKVKQRMSAVMAWCWAHGHVQANPVDVVEHLLPRQQSAKTHRPAMPWRDVPAFARDHVDLGVSEPRDMARACLLFVILTGVRSSEARGATWDEIDLDAATWTIPASRMKMARDHRVPLSRQAVELLTRVRALNPDAALCFPTDTGKELQDMRLSSILHTLRIPSDQPGRTATVHGFRSTLRDWASEHGYSRDLAERALAHAVKDETEAAYHRTDLLEQRRPMMAAWSAWIAGGLRVVDGGSRREAS